MLGASPIKFIIGCHHIFIDIFFPLFAFFIGDDFGEETRSMVVDMVVSGSLLDAI